MPERSTTCEDCDEPATVVHKVHYFAHPTITDRDVPSTFYPHYCRDCSLAHQIADEPPPWFEGLTPLDPRGVLRWLSPEESNDATWLFHDVRALIHLTRHRLTAEQRLAVVDHAMRLATNAQYQTARKFITAVIRGRVDPDDYPLTYDENPEDSDGPEYEATDASAEPEDDDDYRAP